jgi:hypothetical protein
MRSHYNIQWNPLISSEVQLFFKSILEHKRGLLSRLGTGLDIAAGSRVNRYGLRYIFLKLCPIISDRRNAHYVIIMHLYQLVFSFDERKCYSPIRTLTHYLFLRGTKSGRLCHSNVCANHSNASSCQKQKLKQINQDRQ